MPVPYTFGTATAAIPLSQLDSNFATAITLGNTAVYLGNTTTSIGNLTLTNVTISSGNVTLTNVSVTTANVSGTANITTLVATNDATISGLTVGKGAGAVSSNTVLGASALASGSQTGIQNTAVGSSAFASNTLGNYGVAVGFDALSDNTTGTGNTATGRRALFNNTTGSDNQAFGFNSLFSNTTGSNNTSVGSNTLQDNTTASNNTAVGYQAGYTNTTGGSSVYIGNLAGYTSNNNGNTFVGFAAGYYSTGTRNTFIGGGISGSSDGAGSAVTTGSKNTILGTYNGNQGGLDIRTSSNYIVLSDGDGNPRGYWNGANATFNGNLTIGTTSASSQFNITSSAAGLAAMAFVANTTQQWAMFNNGSGSVNNLVIQNSAGSSGVQLATQSATSWSSYSDPKLKNITGTYTNALADIVQIEPIKFTWKSDENNTPCVGVNAETVKLVVPEAVDMVSFSQADEEKYLAVRYTELIPLMIASIQELKAEVDSLKAQINGASA